MTRLAVRPCSLLGLTAVLAAFVLLRRWLARQHGLETEAAEQAAEAAEQQAPPPFD